MNGPSPSKTVTSIAEAMSIKFNARVYELQRDGQKVDVLSLGEAFFDLPEPDFKDLPFPQVYHYSDSRGIPELRHKIAKYYAAYGAQVQSNDQVLITAGSKAAIYMALLASLDPGDEVLIPEPAWVSYSEQVRLCGAVPVGIPCWEPLENWVRYVTPRTRVLIVNTPHNPTGYCYTDEQIDSLVALARRERFWLFSDEAYSDFAAGKFRSTAAHDPGKEHVVVFNSISKNYGISGWRLGYVIANDKLIREILKINQHLITCPATILEYYVARHFEQILEVTKPQIAKLLEKRVLVASFMDSLKLKYMPGNGTFYFFVSIAPSKLGSEAFAMALLEEQSICVVPGIGYGFSCDSYVRVSIGTEDIETLKRALRRLSEFIARTA